MRWFDKVIFAATCLMLVRCSAARQLDDQASRTAKGEQHLTAEELRQEALATAGPLKTVPVVDSPTFKQFVADRVALRRLGKALFWDQQVGSDGQACASCHFHAGADNRSRNQVNPGFRAGDELFSPSQSATGNLGPNHQLTADDFPFHKLADVNDRESEVQYDTNDVVSSQGVFNASFVGLRQQTDPQFPNDIGRPESGFPGSVFTVGTAKVRNVEPRSTPTVINAVLNHRNFWDGRARNEFNGGNPLGSLEPTKIVKVPGRPQKPLFVQTRISDASGASQAVGPPLSDLEMSFADRRFFHLGRKLLSAKPLAKQVVASDDSVLGGVSLTTYEALVKAAIDRNWWDAAPGWVVDVSSGTPQLVNIGASGIPNGNQFTVIEYNFGLFFGLSVNEYEKLLISDKTPFDEFMEGTATLKPEELRGLEIFLGQGRCINCHSGPELTNASLSNVRNFEILERMIMGDNRVAVYDNGFYNIGIRPTAEDVGVGGRIGSKNQPLSNTRFFQDCVKDALASDPSLSVAAANARCGVPRILARPEEAIKLLTRASALVGDPPAVTALLHDAELLLAAHPPDVVQASCKLATNAVLGCLAPGALDLLTPLSLDPEFANLLQQATSLLPDQTSPGTPPQLLGPPLRANERVAVDGAFKAAGLRNLELTAPYFHNGGMTTLRQVVDFYNRGGDFALVNRNDLDPDIQPLGLSDPQKEDLVAFLKTLTDPRVRDERAPFDHPSIVVPNGGFSPPFVFDFGAGTALVLDDLVSVPASGRLGCTFSSPIACTNGLGTQNTPYANFLQSLTP